MLSHVFVGVNDFDQAMAFYGPLLARLGLVLRFTDATRPWAGWQTPGVARPLFLIGKPFDGRAAHCGNGSMNALLAVDRAAVDAAHVLALQHGGRCEGPPGLRPEYHANYYGAYFRDPEGNKLCVCCHDAA